MFVKCIETERNIPVKAMAYLSRIQKKCIQQGYITYSNNSVEVGLKQGDEQYFDTLKSGSGMVHNKREILVSQQQFESLWSETQGKKIEENRWACQLGLQTYGLDIFYGSTQPADCFGHEATTGKLHKNRPLTMNPDAMELG